MIRAYFIVLFLTYIEYFVFLYFLEYAYNITWDNIKFWLTKTPLVCLFFFMIDSWIVATMIYTTFMFPYMFMLYCIKNVNKEKFGLNRILANNVYENDNGKKKKWASI